MSVIPLRPRAKVPALNAWSQYATQLPNPDKQAVWLESFGDGNIGLALGPQSGVIALDIDSVDERVAGVLQKVMPPSPWKRVGKKGAVYAFRFNGEKTFRIKDDKNATIMELLSKGTQVVLPPSIHPDTGEPYHASCELVDVVSVLPVLPPDFEEQLRQALLAAGFSLSSRGVTKVAEWVPAGGRDSAMVANAGILARAVVRGERSLKEAIDEIETWVTTYTEKVVGDPLDPEKAVKKVLEFVRRDIVEGGRRLPPDWSEGLTSEEFVFYHDYFGEEAEEWGLEAYSKETHRIFSEIPAEDMSNRNEAVDKILFRIAKSQHMNELDRSTLLRHIHIASGKSLQISALKARLKELNSDELQGENHTEIAEALKRELEREGEIAFFSSRFYRWHGASWEVLEEWKILSTLAKEFGALMAARRFSDHRGILMILQKICTRELRSDQTSGVNFANGYLTTDMQLFNHDPRFGSTYVLPYRYLSEDARLPLRFLGQLDQCWGMEADFAERVQALREAIAATLFGLAPKYARAFCLFGLSHTGKTTILDIIKGLVPKGSMSSVPPGEWSDRFMPAQMAEKLINFGGDLNENQMIPGGTFKIIVEGGELAGQHKGEQIFVFRPRCAHWFASNHLPRSRDTSGGFTRRWLIWDFNHRIPEEGRNVNLAEEILAEEREDIVAWALPAMRDLMRQGTYTIPPCHEKRVAEIATLNNSVRGWLTSGRVVLKPGSRFEEAEAFGDYFIFTRQERSQPFSIKRFRAAMEELSTEIGFQIGADWTYHGLTRKGAK